MTKCVTRKNHDSTVSGSQCVLQGKNRDVALVLFVPTPSVVELQWNALSTRAIAVAVAVSAAAASVTSSSPLSASHRALTRSLTD